MLNKIFKITYCKLNMIWLKILCSIIVVCIAEYANEKNIFSMIIVAITSSIIFFLECIIELFVASSYSEMAKNICTSLKTDGSLTFGTTGLKVIYVLNIIAKLYLLKTATNVALNAQEIVGVLGTALQFISVIGLFVSIVSLVFIVQVDKSVGNATYKRQQ